MGSEHVTVVHVEHHHGAVDYGCEDDVVLELLPPSISDCVFIVYPLSLSLPCHVLVLAPCAATGSLGAGAGTLDRAFRVPGFTFRVKG